MSIECNSASGVYTLTRRLCFARDRTGVMDQGFDNDVNINNLETQDRRRRYKRVTSARWSHSASRSPIFGAITRSSRTAPASASRARGPA
jgi:hypothetical protein